MLGIHNLSPEFVLQVCQSAVVLRLWIEELGGTKVSVDPLLHGFQMIRLISDTNLNFFFIVAQREIHEPNESLAYSDSLLLLSTR